MMKNQAEGASEHGQITKNELSDGYGGETFPVMVIIGYDHKGYDDYLGKYRSRDAGRIVFVGLAFRFGGLLVGAIVHSAAIQDRDGAPELLASVCSAFPWLRHLFADGAYTGEKLKDALKRLGQ